MGFLDWVEVLALQVLDQGQFEHCAVVGLPQDDRHFRQPEQLGRPPAAFARDEFQMAVPLPNDQRLDNALFFDRVGQLAQRLGREILAGLQRAGTNAVQRDALHALAGIGCRCGLRGRV